MQRISVNTILREDRSKNGLLPIYIRIIADRKKIDVRVSHYVQPGELQPNGSVKKNVFNSYTINQDIQNCLNDVNRVVLFHHVHSIYLTPKSFSDHFHKKVDTSLLHRYIKYEADKLNVCLNRLHSYYALARHIETHFPKVSLADCSFSFLSDLQKVFVTKFKFKKNTITGYMSKLRAILHIAAKNKLIPENPFIHFPLPGYESNREFLTKDELLRIEKFYSEPGNTAQKNVAAAFLFLCYTGLRIGDFTALRIEDIKDNAIDFIQRKTKQKCFVPLSEPAQRFVTVDGFAFRKISPEKMNLYLKDIAKAVGITKPLTCHVARHTFATLSLSIGIDILAISKMLGHSKTATTMIYAKMLDAKKKDEMQKWSGFLDFPA